MCCAASFILNRIVFGLCLIRCFHQLPNKWETVNRLACPTGPADRTQIIVTRLHLLEAALTEGVAAGQQQGLPLLQIVHLFTDAASIISRGLHNFIHLMSQFEIFVICIIIRFNRSEIVIISFYGIILRIGFRSPTISS